MEDILQVDWDLTEDDLTNYQKKITEINDIRYVYYNSDNGELYSISNEYSEIDFPYVIVPVNEVKNILTSHDSIHDYKVIFSPDEKDFVLVKKDQEEEILETIHDVIFQIPFTVDTSIPLIYDTMNDLTFIQDYGDTCWKIYINSSLANSLKDKNLYFDKHYYIYVTAKNDPNILYKTMRVSMANIINEGYFIIPFDNIDYSELPISLYCKKIFVKYQYIKTKI